MASNAVEKRITGHLTDYDQAYLMCRYRSHRWEWTGFYRTRHDGQRYVVSVNVCDSCTMRREDYLGADGSLLSRNYSHPEGYLFKYDEDERAEKRRVRKRDVVRTLFKRETVYDNEDALLARRR